MPKGIAVPVEALVTLRRRLASLPVRHPERVALMTTDQNPAVQYSYAIRTKDTLDITLGGVADYTWNSFWRAAYEKATAGLQRQGDLLVARGNITMDEARYLVDVQRNGLVRDMRNPLTPFGKYYSEFLKPLEEMPNLDKLLAQKGTLEAVLRSVGKSRVAVNRITFIARRAGPAAIAIDIVMTVVVIDLTPPAQRGKVAAQQVGGMAGSVVAARYGGLGGAWAGAELFLLLGSPALAIPVVGEITEGGAMMAGSVFGFFAGGLFGWKTGQAAGGLIWQLAPITWKNY